MHVCFVFNFFPLPFPLPTPHCVLWDCSSIAHAVGVTQRQDGSSNQWISIYMAILTLENISKH